MRRVTYSSLLSRLAGFFGEADGISVEEASLCNLKINFFARLGWEFYFWPETMRTELRTLRASYDAAVTYDAPTTTTASEVFDNASGNYFQALRATTGNPPTTLIGGGYEENSAYWAICASDYTADDWADATDYAVGDQVRNADNGRFYQCHTAHMSAGTLDVTKFGILTRFVRSLDYDQVQNGVTLTPIGTLKDIWDRDPNASPKSVNKIPHWLRDSFILVNADTPTGVLANQFWAEFQLRCPTWSGATRSDTATYAAGVTVYDSATGDFWTSNTAIAAGESPTTNPEKWDRVDFPYFLSEYVTQSAYAALTNKEQEEPENLGVEQTAGYPLLARELDKIERMQGQTKQLRVVSR